MDVLQQSECIQYRIITFRNAASEILLQRDAECLRLPSVELQPSQRHAETICRSLHTEWNCDAVCLFGINIASQTYVPPSVRYQVMECCGHENSGGTPASWVPVDSMSAAHFAELADYEAVRQSRTEYENYSNGLAPGPFAKPGWFGDLRQWVRDSIRPIGIELRDSFCQFNASPTFSLVRLETSGPAVWFKAVGEPNAREFPITVVLTELFPKYTPTIIATRPECNGWLSLEAEGTALDQIQRVNDWEGAATALAGLQIESIGERDRLLSCGARDLRFNTLAGLIDPFFESANELMKQQAKVPPAILNHRELLLLVQRVRAALGRLESLGLPETVGHLDMNPGNVVVSEGSCTFLDWAEAYVGPPFFTFQYLIEHLRRAAGPDSALEGRIIAQYVGQWRAIASISRIEEAFSLASLLAIFAYAAGSNAWSSGMVLRNPQAASYVRSLTRRMQRAALELVDQGSPCLSS